MTPQERRRHPVVRDLPPVAQGIRLVYDLAERAFTSAISHLPNKAAFHELSEQDVPAESAQRLVAFADLAGFKAVNDEHGHAIGDALLRLVGERLSVALDGRGVPFHLSGDEYAVVLGPPHGPEVVEQLAEDMQYVELPLASGSPAVVGVSFGFAGPVANIPLTKLLEQAEVAAAYAKERGDGKPVPWSESLERAPIADPRKKCASCGATTRLQVARSALRPHAPSACGNCGTSFAAPSAD